MKQESEQYTKCAIQVQDKINILAVTWNLFGQLPPIHSLMELSQSNSFSTSPDLIFFGTQECERSLCLSFCCQAKKQWEHMLAKTFNQYSLLITETMGGLHSAIMVKNKIKDYFYFEQRQFMKAGFCNLLGNKGAIGIQISLLGHSFQFINCHLAANQSQTQQRNLTIQRILSNLVSQNMRTEVIFLGDFNYRIDMTNQNYQTMMRNKKVNTEQQMNYQSFFENEQLTNQTALKNNFLVKFQQGKILFPPTYKIGVYNQEYNRERIPGWTDRIFNRRSKQLTRSAYCCEYGIMGSDHRPVLAAFQFHANEAGHSLQDEPFVRIKSSKCQII